jgi:hypothetical protein
MRHRQLHIMDRQFDLDVKLSDATVDCPLGMFHNQ